VVEKEKKGWAASSAGIGLMNHVLGSQGGEGGKRRGLQGSLRLSARARKKKLERKGGSRTAFITIRNSRTVAGKRGEGGTTSLITLIPDQGGRRINRICRGGEEGITTFFAAANE